MPQSSVMDHVRVPASSTPRDAEAPEDIISPPERIFIYGLKVSKKNSYLPRVDWQSYFKYVMRCLDSRVTVHKQKRNTEAKVGQGARVFLNRTEPSYN